MGGASYSAVVDLVFYLRKINIKTDLGHMSKWAFALARHTVKKNEE